MAKIPWRECRRDARRSRRPGSPAAHHYLGVVELACASVRECHPNGRVGVDLVLDLCLSVPLQGSECGSHGLELLGRMTDPVNKLANDAHRLAATEGLGGR